MGWGGAAPKKTAEERAKETLALLQAFPDVHDAKSWRKKAAAQLHLFGINVKREAVLKVLAQPAYAEQLQDWQLDLIETYKQDHSERYVSEVTATKVSKSLAALHDTLELGKPLGQYVKSALTQQVQNKTLQLTGDEQLCLHAEQDPATPKDYTPTDPGQAHAAVRDFLKTFPDHT